MTTYYPNLQFEQFAEQADGFDQGYNTLRWARFTSFAESSVTTGTTSDDGVTPSDTSIAVTTVTVTPTQYRIVASLSDMLLLSTPLPLLEKTAQELGIVMAKKVDSVIQTTVMAGTNARYQGAAANRVALGAGNIITMQDINKAAAVLEANDVPKFDGTYYVTVLHPYQVFDLRTPTTAGSWIDMAKYATPDKLFRGEIGAFAGVRVVTSSHVNSFASTVTVFPALVIGKGAYGVGYAQRPQIMMTPGGASDSDPAAQRRKVSGKVAFGTVILNQNALVRVETSATVA